MVNCIVSICSLSISVPSTNDLIAVCMLGKRGLAEEDADSAGPTAKKTRTKGPCDECGHVGLHAEDSQCSKRLVGRKTCKTCGHVGPHPKDSACTALRRNKPATDDSDKEN